MSKHIILKDNSYLRINGVEGFLLDLFNKELYSQPENLKEVGQRDLKPIEELNFLTDWIYSRTGKNPTVEYIYEGLWYDLDLNDLTIDIDD